MTQLSLLLRWWARLSVAAAVLAVLELLLIALAFVTAVSSGAGALLTWAQLLGIWWLVGALLALPLSLLDREWLRRFLPSSAALGASVVLALLATGASYAIDAALALDRPEFPEHLERLRFGARLLALSALLAACLALFPRLRALPWLVSVASSRALLLSVLGLAALLLLWLAHFAFGPVHEVGAAAICSMLALPIAAIMLRALGWPGRTRDAQVLVAAVGLTSLLGAYVPGAARDHARFVLWGHSSVAGLAEALRSALDRDGDAALPAWLGGAGDCAPTDAAVGPLQLEVPGDQVDQDCRGGDAPRPGAPSAPTLPGDCKPLAKPDVLLIVVDALRFDAVTPITMPSLTELARNAFVFERAYSPTGMTFTSVTSILAGRVFSDTGPQNALLDENLEPPRTAPEDFRAAGYRTAAFSDFFDHKVFRRGFQAVNAYVRDHPVHGVKGQLTSAAMVQGALGFLGRDAAPAFVWMHIADTHAPYARARDAEGRMLTDELAYLRGVSYVDQQLGRLLMTLRQRQRLERTIVAITADHGEELLARGRHGHGPNLFEESVHVPLVLWVPGCAARHVSHPVSLSRLTPSLAALSGVEARGPGLFDVLDLPTVVEGVTGLGTTYKRAVIAGHHKLMLDVTNGGRMLFDLQSDPAELTNLLPDAPARAAELERGYQRWLDTPGHR